MSGVKRYGIHFAVKHMIKEDDDGEYVLASDYDQLHAANQRLQSELAELKAEEPEWSAQMQRLGDANQRLEGEVKRLREALRTLLGLMHHKATTPLELESIRMSEAALSTANGEVE